MGPSAQETVQRLYRALLGRNADSGGLAHYVSWLSNGEPLETVVRALVGSDEYAARSSNTSQSRLHPLAHAAQHYEEEDVSFFMHRGQFRPLTLSIETTNLCNNDCIICPYSSQTRPRRIMPLDLFEKVLGDYTEIGGGPVSLTPLVGEVLLDELLLERLTLLRGARAVTTVAATTNAVMASRVDDGVLAQIVAGFDRLNVSVYGLDAEEYKIMTRRDHYQLFRENLIRILTAAGPDKVLLGVRSLRDRSEMDIARWRDEVAREAGLTHLEIHTSTSTFANWSFFDTAKPLPLQGKWLPLRKNSSQCGIPLLGAQVLVDGRVSFCACANFDGTSELIIGDMYHQSLAEILATDEVRRLWDWDANGVPGFCRTCSFHTPLTDVTCKDWVYRDPMTYIGG